VDAKEPRDERPEDKPAEDGAPGGKTVSIWQYLEKDDAAGGKTYRGSHRVEDKDQ
jgi:hypothetical protein